MKVKLNPIIQRQMVWLSGLVALSLLLILVTACQGYGTPATPKTSPAPTTTPKTTPAPTTTAGTVAISGFAFNPGTITVAVGTRVTWTNRDSAPHKVASDTGLFNSSNLATNASFSFSFNNRGTFSYRCGIHSSMKGKVVVE